MIINPIIHYGKKESWVAVVCEVETDGKKVLEWRFVTSKRRAIKLKDILSRGVVEFDVLPAPPKELLGRWSVAARKEFREGDTKPSLRRTFKRLRKVIETYIDFPMKGAVDVTSLWIIMTYVYPILPAVPYYCINGPKGSGKTALLDLLSYLVFNPHFFTDMTPAALFRTLGRLPGTILVDEFEEVSQKTRIVLNAGYKRTNTSIRRCNQNGKNAIDTFAIFGPKVYASINFLNDVLLDRCIEILIQPAPAGSPVLGKHVSQGTSEYEKIRADLYAWSMLFHHDVTAALQSVVLPSKLINREREKFLPLFALASLIDANGNLGLATTLEKYSGEQSNEDEQDERIFYALRVLRDHMPDGKVAYTIQPKKVADEMSKKLGSPIDPRSVGYVLRQLRFQKQRKESGSVYRITEGLLKQVEARFPAN